jgi:uncharacterized membrane protein
MIEYLTRAIGVWFLGFFPLAEIYIAVPAGVAAGLDNVSVLFWSVFGNFVPVLLITGLYETLTRNERLRTWLDGLLSEKAEGRINQYGIWFVLVATPFIGVWVMSVTAKFLGMDSRRYVIAAFVSILVYAVGILVLIRLGLAAFLQ